MPRTLPTVGHANESNDEDNNYSKSTTGIMNQIQRPATPPASSSPFLPLRPRYDEEDPRLPPILRGGGTHTPISSPIHGASGSAKSRSGFVGFSSEGIDFSPSTMFRD